MTLVRFFDFIGKKMGNSFGIIFKIIIPFIVTFFPIDQVSGWIFGSMAKVLDFVLWAALLVLLLLAPRAASIAEFIIIGFALVLTIGSGTIDHLWGWCVMIAGAVFLFFKILFLLTILIKKANGIYDTDPSVYSETKE
ncbi:MAG: hypothetical protein ACI4RL_07835 [Ruminococcus sp.]